MASKAVATVCPLSFDQIDEVLMDFSLDRSLLSVSALGSMP